MASGKLINILYLDLNRAVGEDVPSSIGYNSDEEEVFLI
jgi:hypothetical protein